MRDILDQIDAATAANLYYVALFTALTVPDMAGALDSPRGTANHNDYARWFDRHVGDRYKATHHTLTGKDCYKFRNSMLHQGSAQITNGTNGMKRIFFREPGPGIWHNNLISVNGVAALNIDVRVFCKDITDCARAWLAEVEPTPRFKTNFAKFVARHPNGLAPFVAGGPVIG